MASSGLEASEPISLDKVDAVRSSILVLLGIIVAFAVIVLFTYSWLDSRKVPTITFLATPQSLIAVDVRGAVSTPGVVHLQPGARLIDVLNSSGGMAPNADHTLVNLSSRVLDGQMVIIPTLAPEGDTQSTTGLININTAGVDQLKELPGIGDVFAQRIVTYRELNGPFQSAEDLEDVEGISASLVESITPFVTVSGND